MKRFNKGLRLGGDYSVFLIIYLRCSFNWEKVFVVTKTRAKFTLNPLAKEKASSEYNQQYRHAFLRRARTTASIIVRRFGRGYGCVSVTFKNSVSVVDTS